MREIHNQADDATNLARALLQRTKGVLPLEERHKVADSLGRCAVCGRTGNYTVHPNPVGTGKLFMNDPVALVTCSCGQNSRVKLEAIIGHITESVTSRRTDWRRAHSPRC